MSGELACLTAAGLWAVAVTVFRPAIVRFGAPAVNLMKSLIASFLLGITVLVTGQWEVVTGAEAEALWLIAGSGIIGLTLGDTALFAAVAKIGPYRTMLFQTLAPVFTALFAIVWLGTFPTLAQSAGVVVILAGVLLVVAPARRHAGMLPEPKVLIWGGYLLAILSAAGQGVGIVLAKDGMVEMALVPATFFRLLVAAAGLVVLALVSRRLGTLRQVAREPAARWRIGGASVLGTYLAMLFMMAGIRLAPPAVSATLLSTTPVFSMFIEARTTGEKITPRRWAGTAIAILGVAILAT
jgi:uncharacterized membrane protein